MSNIRRNLIYAAINRAWSLIDPNIHADLHKQYEFMQQTILADNSLTTDEKNEAIRLNNMYYDRDRILYNEGTRRICEYSFHSKLYDFNIPKNIDDFGQSSNQNNKRNSNAIEAGNTRLTNVFKELRVNSKSLDTVQNNYYRDTIQQPQTGDIDDDDEYNNPNLHSEEQEEFEIPDEGF
ncbi:kinase-like domain-containing protein [Rhizophagus irregularis DAOM 181602=DAOM 197198]|nr:kinase-like domain-containing protein [Rhizophagus irregularis DAOM 181602=DAOM 197198]